jgi:hypothetical protein
MTSPRPIHGPTGPPFETILPDPGPARIVGNLSFGPEQVPFWGALFVQDALQPALGAWYSHRGGLLSCEKLMGGQRGPLKERAP